MTVHQGGARWSLELWAGRASLEMNREHPEIYLSGVRALLDGSDRQHYYRADGFTAGLERETTNWRAGVRFRDVLEGPLAITTSWNLFHQPLEVPGNVPAVKGRAHEVRFEAGWRLPRIPITLDGRYQTSGNAIGSDFEYRRARVAMAGDLPLGRFLALVPQAAYGRLSGTMVPQAAFYLGGPSSLRSLPVDRRGGTGLAIARLDLVETPDVLTLAHIPHPAMFPLQLGLFAASGAAWGDDPYGGPPPPGVDWPERQDWVSETGLSFIYQPGIPDPLWMVRVNTAWALGPQRETLRWSVSYTRAFDFVRPFTD
jgi:hypothetical protein